jgi:hypothetical protein
MIEFIWAIKMEQKKKISTKKLFFFFRFLFSQFFSGCSSFFCEFWCKVEVICGQNKSITIKQAAQIAQQCENKFVHFL